MPSRSILALLMLMSGAAALTLEMVWLRRLSVVVGSAGVSATITLALYMFGLGLGGFWGARHHWKVAPREYGMLEIGVATWAVLFPWTLDALTPHLQSVRGTWASLMLALPLLVPPAVAHGATLPAMAAVVAEHGETARLYALNTLGAVAGILLSSFVLLPWMGVRGTELTAAALCAVAGGLALGLPVQQTGDWSQERTDIVASKILVAAGVAGGVSMALEIIWGRLGALLIGGSVYAFAVVLAVFLVGISVGAMLGRRTAKKWLPHCLAAVGALTMLGSMVWPWLPHGLGIAWEWFGDGVQLPAAGILLAGAMAGAPVASGMVFGLCLQQGNARTAAVAGQVLCANTIGGVAGVLLAGTVALPWFGIVATTVGLATICLAVACWLSPFRSFRWCATLGGIVLWVAVPTWDVAVYATGLYNRIDEFVDLSPRAIERFANEGWTLRYYRDGQTASVAVGQSDKTGNVWLSINGKVDASTGADMPTQILSGRLPLSIYMGRGSVETLVIGLASGVTAAEARKSGARPLTVVELEPAVVEASQWFSSVNEDVLQHPDTTLRVEDARAMLALEDKSYDVIISEPSNPWISGVSNLFTQDYWRLGRSRLNPDGVFCQWVQLYALPPEAFRSLLATYLSIFPNTWLFETIPGSDALLISAPDMPAHLPMPPTLNPSQLELLSNGARINTDDHPWIEFEAPKWLNRSTGRLNQQLIEHIQREK